MPQNSKAQLLEFLTNIVIIGLTIALYAKKCRSEEIRDGVSIRLLDCTQQSLKKFSKLSIKKFNQIKIIFDNEFCFETAILKTHGAVCETRFFKSY